MCSRARDTTPATNPALPLVALLLFRRLSGAASGAPTGAGRLSSGQPVYFGSAQNVSSPTFSCVCGLSPISTQAIALGPDCLLTSFCVALFELQSTTCLSLSMQSPTFAFVPPQPAGARAAAAPSPHASDRKCPLRAFICGNPLSSVTVSRIGPASGPARETRLPAV